MSTVRKILIWILIFAVAILLQRNIDSLHTGLEAIALSTENDFLSKILTTIQWFAVFAIVNILINNFFWDIIFSRRVNNKVPGLLKYISSFFLAVIFISLLTTQVFGQSIIGILALSGGLSIVIGLTLQNTINDFFSGIIIHLEKPFTLGNFIKLNNRRLSDEPLIGRVVSINWRTSRIQKTDNTTVVVPNNLFTTMVLTNFSLPENKSRFELEFSVGLEYETDRVINIILSAVLPLDSILQNPKPKVKVPRINSSGAIYRVRYWVDPSVTSPSRARDTVNRAVIKYLEYAGIDLANEKSEVYFAPIGNKEIVVKGKKEKLISEVLIFKNLSSENLSFLYDDLKEINVKSGHTIVNQWQEGDSMFIISEGNASVYLQTDKESEPRHISKLGPGQFFGEMSLVLGEPRNATVKADSECYLYEISKETMQELFNKDANLLDHIVEVIDSRKNKNQNLLLADDESANVKNERYLSIKNKIKSLFKIF